jgi:hypothetical protein
MERIIARSEAKSWAEAKLEWNLVEIFEDRDSPGTCLCGHYPITEQCILVNRINGNRVVVGNVCVKRFLGLPTDNLFQALRRIEKNTAAALNEEMILHAHAHGWINDWEKMFYLDTIRERKLSPRQRAIRVQINEPTMQDAGEPDAYTFSQANCDIDASWVKGTQSKAAHEGGFHVCASRPSRIAAAAVHV